MDTNKVERLARHHWEIAVGQADATQRDTAAARRAEAQGLERLLQEIERQCAEFSAAYNEAFGATQIHCERHTDTVIVRSVVDQQDTVVFHRLLPSDTHRGGIEAHRYHYPTPPVHLPVAVRPSGDDRLMLTYRDRDVAPDDLVLELLSEFTVELARAQRRRTAATGTPDRGNGPP